MLFVCLYCSSVRMLVSLGFSTVKLLAFVRRSSFFQFVHSPRLWPQPLAMVRSFFLTTYAGTYLWCCLVDLKIQFENFWDVWNFFSTRVGLHSIYVELCTRYFTIEAIMTMNDIQSMILCWTNVITRDFCIQIFNLCIQRGEYLLGFMHQFGLP